ncbi:unnamed protein product [Lymnaea stagnalis]|uniref:Uncharacterized protein n=1 Tax=Lymnaea stagnalis TaxID=6523 RepID=A0AAV2HL19_LYMST
MRVDHISGHHSCQHTHTDSQPDNLIRKMAISSCMLTLVFSCVLLVVLVHCEETDHFEDRDVDLDEPQLAERFSGELRNHQPSKRRHHIKIYYPHHWGRRVVRGSEEGPEKRQGLDTMNSISSTSLEKRIEHELTDIEKREVFNALNSLEKKDSETLREKRQWWRILLKIATAIFGKRADKTLAEAEK